MQTGMFDRGVRLSAALIITVLAASAFVVPAAEARSVAVGGGPRGRVNRRVRRPIRNFSLESSEEDSIEDAVHDDLNEDSSEDEDEDDDYDREDVEAMRHLQTKELMRLLHLLESLRGGSLQVHQISGNDAAQLNFLLDKFGL